jgi:hypothetical protein
MDPLIGVKLLTRYRVDSLAGDDGGVLVYEATDILLDRCVFVKVASPEVMRDHEAFAEFQREARDETAVDFGNVAGLPYFIATEWDRPTLKPEPPTPSAPEVPIPIYVEDVRASSVRAWASVALVLLVGVVSGVAGFFMGR